LLKIHYIPTKYLTSTSHISNLYSKNITYVVSLYPTPETLFLIRKQGNPILLAYQPTKSKLTEDDPIKPG